jgi:hypothetical protein
MHDLDRNKQAPNKMPIMTTQQPNLVKFNREPSPLNYPGTANNNNTQRQSNREVSPSNIRQVPQQNNVFGNIKESFTYI